MWTGAPAAAEDAAGDDETADGSVGEATEWSGELLADIAVPEPSTVAPAQPASSAAKAITAATRAPRRFGVARVSDGVRVLDGTRVLDGVRVMDVVVA
jgi:hypothetical protein